MGMTKQDARDFASRMEDILNIPAFICEKMEQELIDGKFESVCTFILNRLKECDV